ncbi:MAG: MYXO-CTERM sorting domain-containing protein [Verrucomicrobiota bacterium JB023]|nr:MYXO-CTERM sorting domain-containing protein [Verrucomicrobiota bacterium JB023]
MKKNHLALALTVCATSLPASGAIVLYQHTFDEVANDSSPSIQGFSNGVGGATSNLLTGQIGGGGSSGTGFNTSASLDLSAYDVLMVEFVVENNASGIAGAGLNGAFFGITSSPTSNVTGGTALYNNAGSADGPAFGLQVGTGRGANSADYVFDMQSGNGQFTDLSNAFVDDATDGYTVMVTYALDSGTGNTAVSIETSGLASDISFSTVQDIAYADFSSAVTPNVSAQGSVMDLASITVSTIPEPSAAMLGSLALLAALGRRRRGC